MNKTSATNGFPRLTADEADAMIFNGALVGFSGFTPAGAAKAVPRALADRVNRMHEDRLPMRIRVLTGASTDACLDEALAAADAISWRVPYQSSRTLRSRINSQQVQLVEMHLSHLPQMIEFGFLAVSTLQW